LIKTQPLHTSQVVTKDNEEFIEFKFDVYPSPELYAKLLSFGADLEVVSPAKIRAEFKSTLEAALKRY
jgi:predicted DNA-binding transcriptional regulator YafY